MLVVTVASSVRLLNSFVPPASAANVSVPLAASRIVTVLVPATHEAEVESFVHNPLIVHADAPRLTIVPAVSMTMSPVTTMVEFRPRTVPRIANGRVTVRPQLVAVAPVPVTAVGAVVPRIPITAKASSPADAGEIEMLGFAVVPLALVPPAVGVGAQTPLRSTVAHTCFAVPLTSVAVIVCAPLGIAP